MSLLYEAEQRSLDVADVVAAQVVPPDQLTKRLVDGVADHASEIDNEISQRAKGWSLSRMPALDRTILRVATFELLHRSDVPVAVVIDEAVTLAKRFSTDDSGRFVNGVLSAVVPAPRPR